MMLKGKTKSGFSFSISDETLNNYELLEVISVVDDNPLKLPQLMNMLLGSEQAKKLKDHVRTENGFVPMDVIQGEIMEIFQSGPKSKNS